MRTYLQGSLLDGHQGPNPERTIAAAFQRFHAENPQVYERLVTLARSWRTRRGAASKCGIKMLFEVLRYEVGMQTSGDDFKLNNNYHSYYARKIMEQEHDLAHPPIFDLRRLHGPEAS